MIKVGLFAISEASETVRRYGEKPGNLLMIFHKWSLLDVLVISAVVFTLSEIPFLEVEIAIAAYWYVAYVVFLLAYHLILKGFTIPPWKKKKTDI